MEAKNLYLFASDITVSEEKSNDIFLTIGMRMQSTRPNKNKEGVTKAFIDEIVANPDKYNCLPLYVDTSRLISRDFKSLGHKLNRVSGRFGTVQVGSMRDFKIVEDEYGFSQIGEARIPKREGVICERVTELYERGELNFSFELVYREEDVIFDNGVMYIDVGEHNALTGMAIVSVPAYKEAFALSLIAEEQIDTEVSVATDEGVETMNEAENIVTEQIATDEVSVAEEAVSISEETNVEANEQTVAEATEAVQEPAVAEEVAISEEDEEEKNSEEPEDSEEKTDEDETSTAEAEPAIAEEATAEETIAETEAQEADWYAKYLAIEAEMANLYAMKAAADAEIERLRAIEAELNAIRAAERAAELANKQNTARVFAQKQGLDVNDEAVASAIAELDYAKIAELSMANETNHTDEVVTVASYAETTPMKINGKFDRVLARVSD